jgi:hypothetical protein
MPTYLRLVKGFAFDQFRVLHVRGLPLLVVTFVHMPVWLLLGQDLVCESKLGP